MSNKVRLSNNNIDLQELIDKANSLPTVNEWVGGTEIVPGNEDITIPAYINQELTVKAVPTEELTVTPSDSVQVIEPSDGKYINKVTVGIGSSEIVNSIIEEYTASSGEINANTFIQFVIGSYSAVATKQISSSAYTGINPKAVLIDDTRVLVSYINSDLNACYAVIVTIENSTISVGTTTLIKSASTTFTSSVLLVLYFSNYNKAIISYCANNSSMFGTESAIVSISGTSITVDSTGNTAPFGANGSMILTDTQYIVWSYYTMYIYTFDGTTITQAATKSMSIYVNDMLKISDSSYLCLGYRTSDTSGYYLTAEVIDISGTTITENTATVICSERKSGYFLSTTLLDDGRYFIAHAYYYSGNSTEILYGTTMTISDDKTITAGFTAAIDGGTSSGGYATAEIIKAGLIEGNKVIILHTQNYSNKYLKISILTVGTSSFSLSQNTVVNSSVANSGDWCYFMLPSGQVYIIYGATNSVLTSVLKNTITTSTSTINGVTKTKATTTEKGQVYVLG